MKKLIIMAGAIIYGLFIVGVVVVLIGCKSFEPVEIEGQPAECNDFYTVMQYYSVQGNDSAFVGTVYEKCIQARKANTKIKIQDLCKKLYSDDFEKFSNCIK